jgi:hypothetical protein
MKEGEIGSVGSRHEREYKRIKILVGKPEGKKPFGRTRRRWSDNIIMYLREIGWECVGWIHLSRYMGELRAIVNR